jgi:hypothetical protein
MPNRPLLAALLFAALAAPAVLARAEPVAPPSFPLLSTRPAALRPQLMIVGVGHFSNPHHDVVNTDVDDVTAPRRQKEMAAVVDALARFRPTHIAVEWPSAKQDKLDARYAAYRAGTYRLASDEVDQLGLRLAAKLKLPRVDAADWLDEPPGQDADYDFMAFPNTPEAKARRTAIMDPAQGARDTAEMRRLTLGAWLHALNSPERRAEMNRIYFDYAMLGDEVRAPGANWVGAWHTRNLRIFARLVRLADKPDDRVLVIYGAGHGFLLSEFAEESGAFRTVSPEPLLATAAKP